MKSADLGTWEDLNNVLWPTSNPYDNFGAWTGYARVDDDGTEQLKVYYDVETREWVIDASQSSLADGARKDIRRGTYNIATEETFDVRVFIDGSVVEVFINGEDHFTGRFFPTLPSSDGIEMFVGGGIATAENVKIWEMQSSPN